MSEKIKKITITYGGKTVKNYNSREYQLGMEIEVTDDESVEEVILSRTNEIKTQVETEIANIWKPVKKEEDW